MRRLTLDELLRYLQTKRLDIATPMEPRYPKEGTDFIVAEFKTGSTEPDLVEHVRFAASELIRNGIEHGNRMDPSRKLHLFCAWIHDTFYFVVQDEGEGFNLARPNYEGAPQPEGGLGLLYSKEAMDEVYNFRDSASYACICVPGQARKSRH